MKTKQKITVRFALADVLTAKGITQTRAAEITGVSRQSISVLAGEPTQIQFDTIAKLCAGLDVKPCDLFALEEIK